MPSNKERLLQKFVRN